MKENVGTLDRIARSIAGPALILLGYSRWGGHRGELGGLAAIVAGTTLIESAITRVCPVNGLLRIDTRRHALVEKDLRKTQKIVRRMESRLEQYSPQL
ncbi:MAG: DUF2892 domain-containing protein [Bradymonadaceae bacterium]|nr:DUF2892 domain-containing protein [Lujinxingiaceae bacterium]